MSPELSLSGEEWVVEEGREKEGAGCESEQRRRRDRGSVMRGHARFWILIQRAVGSHRRLQSDGARSVQSRPGVREEESVVWSAVGGGNGMLFCCQGGWWVPGSPWHPPRNFWVCPQLLPPPGGGDCQEAGVSAAGLGGGGPGAEGGHCVQRHVRVLPNSRGDPHLRAGRQPGGPGRAHGGSSDSPPRTHSPGLLCSWVPGVAALPVSGISLRAQGGRARRSLN